MLKYSVSGFILFTSHNSYMLPKNSDHPPGRPLDHDLRHPLRLLVRHQAARGRVENGGGQGEGEDGDHCGDQRDSSVDGSNDGAAADHDDVVNRDFAPSPDEVMRVQEFGSDGRGRW